MEILSNVNVGYAWREQFKNNPPEVPTVNNHVGSYPSLRLMVPASWNGKEIDRPFRFRLPPIMYLLGKREVS